MGLLEDIIAHKKNEVRERIELYPTGLLEKSSFFRTPCVSLTKYLSRPDKVGIIAEIKRFSPSKGELNSHISVEALSIGYMQAGASALSILTDKKFFGGSNKDLETARKFNYCPILRKEFVIDPYQIVEAKAIGADVVLLIARILEPNQLKTLASTAKGLGLEVLVEVHDESELERACVDHVDLIGVNNRNLDTLQMNVELSFELASKIPTRYTKISESGISDAATLIRLKQVGYQGFLIGEAFMRTSKPEAACAQLIQEVRKSLGEVDILSA